MRNESQRKQENTQVNMRNSEKTTVIENEAQKQTNWKKRQHETHRAETERKRERIETKRTEPDRSEWCVTACAFQRAMLRFYARLSARTWRA